MSKKRKGRDKKVGRRCGEVVESESGGRVLRQRLDPFTMMVESTDAVDARASNNEILGARTKEGSG